MTVKYHKRLFMRIFPQKYFIEEEGAYGILKWTWWWWKLRWKCAKPSWQQDKKLVGKKKEYKWMKTYQVEEHRMLQLFQYFHMNHTLYKIYYQLNNFLLLHYTTNHLCILLNTGNLFEHYCKEKSKEDFILKFWQKQTLAGKDTKSDAHT